MAKSLKVELFKDVLALHEYGDELLCNHLKNDTEVACYEAIKSYFFNLIIKYGLLPEFENFLVSPIDYEILYYRYNGKVPNLCKD